MYIPVTHARKNHRKTYETIKDTQEEPWLLHIWRESHDFRQVFLPFAQPTSQAERLLDQKEWFFNPSNSEEAFELINFWLSEYAPNHTACQRTTSCLPTRVIDVGPVDGSQNPFLLESMARLRLTLR